MQLPDNLDEPAHRIMREVAAEAPWAGEAAGRGRAQTPAATPRTAYYRELWALQRECQRVANDVPPPAQRCRGQ